MRTLSAEQWGRFSFVFSFLGVLSVFTELGVGGIAIKGLLADEDRPGFAGAYITLRGALGALSYALAVGFVVVAGYPAEVVHAMAIAGVVMVIASVCPTPTKPSSRPTCRCAPSPSAWSSPR